MGLLRLEALRDARLPHRERHAKYTLLQYAAELTCDHAPPDATLRRTDAKIAADTPLSRKQIKSARQDMAASGIIRIDTGPGRYNVEYGITITDPAYIDALTALQSNQEPLPLVSGQNGTSQNGAITLVSGQNGTSHECEKNSPHASGQNGTSQHGAITLVSGQNGTSPPRQVGRLLDQYLNDLRSKKDLPTYKPTSQDGQKLNRRMLWSLIPQPPPDFLKEASEVLDPSIIFAIGAQFVADRDQGTVRNGAFLDRLAKADPDCTPQISSHAASEQFYFEYIEEVHSYENSREQEAQPDPPPLVKEREALSQNGKVSDRPADPEITTDPPPPVTAHPARSHDRPGAGQDDLWDRVLHELELQLPETTFETWVRDTSTISHTEGEIIIGAPHRYARDWLRGRLSRKVEILLSRFAGQTMQVSFEVRGEPQPDLETPTPTPASSAGKAALELATGPPTTDTGAGEPTEPQPDLLRQAKDAEIEYRQAKIVHRNRSRKRRKPARNAVHPSIPGQVQQPQQNHLA